MKMPYFGCWNFLTTRVQFSLKALYVSYYVKQKMGLVMNNIASLLIASIAIIVQIHIFEDSNARLIGCRVKNVISYSTLIMDQNLW